MDYGHRGELKLVNVTGELAGLFERTSCEALEIQNMELSKYYRNRELERDDAYFDLSVLSSNHYHGGGKCKGITCSGRNSKRFFDMTGCLKSWANSVNFPYNC